MKVKLFINLAVLALVLSACGVNKKAFNNSKNVAVISFNSSEQVKNNSSVQARLITEARFDSASIEDPAGKVQDNFYKLDPILTSKVVDEKPILASESFQKYAEENAYNLKTLDAVTTMGGSYVAVEGYPVIKAFSKNTIMEAFEHLPKTVDAVIVVSNTFMLQENMTFQMGDLSSAGLGGQRVVSVLSFYMVNRAGKKIVQRDFRADSGEKLDKDKRGTDLDELASRALDASFRELNSYLLKKLKD